MGFQIHLVNDVDAVPVAQAVEKALVGVVAGADGVDVVPLHGHNIQLGFLLGDTASPGGGELVAVHPPEEDAPAVEQHQAVLDLEPAQAHRFPYCLRQYAVPVEHFNHQFVQAGLFRAPEPGAVHRQNCLLHCREGDFSACNLPLSVVQTARGIALAYGLHENADLAGGEIIAEGRGNLHIPDMHRRKGVQVYLPEDAGEAEKVLILHPTGVGVLEHLGGQLVFSGNQIVRQLKLRGSESVLPIACVMPVAPYCKAALRPLEGDENPHPREALRQGEVLHIASHRVEFLGYLSRLYILAAVPGILGIHILGTAVSLELNVGGHRDGIPAPAV